MITNGLLVLMKGIVDFMIATRPPWQLHIDGLGAMVAWWQGWDDLAPIHESMLCVSILLAGFLATTGLKWYVKIVDWVADVIP